MCLTSFTFDMDYLKIIVLVLSRTISLSHFPLRSSPTPSSSRSSYFLFIINCNNLDQNNHSYKEKEDLVQTLGKLQDKDSVCTRTSLYCLYKHTNLSKTSKQKVLTAVWAMRVAPDLSSAILHIPGTPAES